MGQTVATESAGPHAAAGHFKYGFLNEHTHTMKQPISSTFALSAILAVSAVSCSQSTNRDAALQEEIANQKKQIAALETTSRETKNEVSKLQSAVQDKEREVNRAVDKLRKFNEYVVNPQLARGELLTYLQFHDVSRANDAYDAISQWGLWFDKKYLQSSHLFFETFFATFDRSGPKIESAFTRYSADIYAVLPKVAYETGLAKGCVEALLSAHANISKSSDYKLWLDAMAKDPRLLESGTMRAALLAEFEKKFGLLPNDLELVLRTREKRRTELKFWAYSFWLRRHLEGNAAQVATILAAIKQKYK